MTPNEIEILIHCHVSPVKHPRGDAPAVREALLFLEADGLIEKIEDGDGVQFRTTSRGKAHVASLCSLPLPELQWVDPLGNIIEI